MFFVGRLIEQPDLLAFAALVGRFLMVAPTVEGIDLFKIAGRSISGWVPSFKMGTVAPIKQTLTRARHYNLVYLHARRKNFLAFADIATTLQEIWPWEEVASVEEVESRLAGRWPTNLVEAVIWKAAADAAAAGHLLVDLERHTLDRHLPLVLLPPDAPPLVPDPLPDTLLPEPEVVPPAVLPPEVLCVRRVP